MEFIVSGAPRSANANPRSRRRWRDRVGEAAQEALRQPNLPMDREFAVVIIYFYRGDTTLDVDNIAKSLLDGIKGVMFRDDRQVSQLLVRRPRLSAGLSLTGASPFLLDAIERMERCSLPKGSSRTPNMRTFGVVSRSAMQSLTVF
jgi:hypothetical protein